jgi:roadblock/LC7 domain-containing protein
MPGTNIPGVLTAGTFYQDGKRVFWDGHNPENTVVIELRDERYNELIVEVADPQAAAELVKAALPR